MVVQYIALYLYQTIRNNTLKINGMKTLKRIGNYFVFNLDKAIVNIAKFATVGMAIIYILALFK